MRKQNRKLSHSFAIPCGLVARIRRSHRRGRGSIPCTEGLFFRSYRDEFFLRTQTGLTDDLHSNKNISNLGRG